jgi:hypothetical protein
MGWSREAGLAAEPDRALQAGEERRRLRAWTAVAGALVFLVLYVAAHNPPGRDFGVFYRTAGRFLRGEDLYRLADGNLAFKYAPAAAALFAPLRIAGPRAAWLGLNLLSAVALLRVMQWSARALGASGRLLTHAIVLALAAPFAAHLLSLGQCDALLLWWMAESERLARRRPWTSGLLWAAAVIFKPPYLIFLAPAVGWLEGRRMGALLLGLTAGVLVGTARYGFTGHLAELRDWRISVGATTPHLLCNEQNQSVYALACRYLVPPSAGLGFAAAVAALALLAVGIAAASVLRIRVRDDHAARFAAAATAFWLSAFLSPLGWWTNLVATIPAFYLLVELARAAPSASIRRLAGTVLVVLLVALEVPQRLGIDVRLLLAIRQYGLLAWAGVLVALLGAGSAVRVPSPPSTTGQRSTVTPRWP